MVFENVKLRVDSFHDHKSLFIFQVKHSQKLSETPIETKDHIIQNLNNLTAHCNCIVGLGESCGVHVGAVLFYLEANWRCVK